jgi:hypothetical protein
MLGHVNPQVGMQTMVGHLGQGSWQDHAPEQKREVEFPFVVLLCAAPRGRDALQHSLLASSLFLSTSMPPLRCQGWAEGAAQALLHHADVLHLPLRCLSPQPSFMVLVDVNANL